MTTDELDLSRRGDRATGRVGRGGVGEKPFEGYAPTGSASLDWIMRAVNRA